MHTLATINRIDPNQHFYSELGFVLLFIVAFITILIVGDLIAARLLSGRSPRRRRRARRATSSRHARPLNSGATLARSASPQAFANSPQTTSNAPANTPSSVARRAVERKL